MSELLLTLSLSFFTVPADNGCAPFGGGIYSHSEQAED